MYYESHVTIEPIFDDRLEQAKQLALKHKFKVANLLMQKRNEDSPERSKYDTFMTGHYTTNPGDLNIFTQNMKSLIKDLQDHGFKVWRYKIEHVILDSRTKDEYQLL